MDMTATHRGEGLVAIVTGAARGIGRAIAAALAGTGATIVAVDANGAGAEATAAALGGATMGVQADISDETSVQAMVDRVVERHGRIDILVNNAAINMSTSGLGLKPFWEIGLAEWNLVMGVNATGTFLCSRAVSAVMRRQASGRIVNLASTVVNFGRPNYLHYVSSKAAIIGMTRSMARELGPHGITVNAISPGPVETEVERAEASVTQHQRLLAMQCIPQAVTGADLTEAVLFLCSPGARLITGQVIAIDGGATHN